MLVFTRDDVLKKMIMSGHDLEKLNEHPTRISAPLVKAPPVFS